MGRVYVQVGYVVDVEMEKDIWVPSINEKNYYGDTMKLGSRWQTSDKVNGELSVNHVISIISDPYADNNFSNIRYVVWMGVKWTVTSVEVQRPRLILYLGGVYNGA